MSDPLDHLQSHLAGEATPQEVTPSGVPAPKLGFHDSHWSEEEWQSLVNTLIKAGVGSWKDIAALVLGHLNPSQVGTSLASSKGFKRRYGKGNTMRIVMDWVYQQNGRCADCGARLELQADHIKGREAYADKLDADFIENMTLRCRRCNVVRRPSHEFGGLTFLTAEAALMWILLVIRPRTFLDYVRMCRLYGMTMSDIRMQEAWAMAHWLAKSDPPAFGIEDDLNSFYDLLVWSDSAVTRVDVGSEVPKGVAKIYENIPGSARLGFITVQSDQRLKFFEHPLAFLPFSTYDLGPRPAQDLCIRYLPPDREDGQPQQIVPLPPRNVGMLCHAIALPDQHFELTSKSSSQSAGQELAPAPTHGRLIKTKLASEDCQIVAI